MAGAKASIGGPATAERHMGRIERLKLALEQLPAEAAEKRAELEAALVHHVQALKALGEKIAKAIG